MVQIGLFPCEFTVGASRPQPCSRCRPRALISQIGIPRQSIAVVSPRQETPQLSETFRSASRPVTGPRSHEPSDQRSKRPKATFKRPAEAQRATANNGRSQRGGSVSARTTSLSVLSFPLPQTGKLSGTFDGAIARPPRPRTIQYSTVQYSKSAAVVFHWMKFVFWTKRRFFWWVRWHWAVRSWLIGIVASEAEGGSAVVSPLALAKNLGKDRGISRHCRAVHTVASFF